MEIAVVHEGWSKPAIELNERESSQIEVVYEDVTKNWEIKMVKRTGVVIRLNEDTLAVDWGELQKHGSKDEELLVKVVIVIDTVKRKVLAVSKDIKLGYA